ncbi:MAG: DNA alkylation repair protein [Calditrichaeota bacterium]|nr:DNA alkylation repair protein [Calditrichota bacterium]MCB9365640.1 DNA alkylation repair protein [Calditrichota bacterium]
MTSAGFSREAIKQLRAVELRNRPPEGYLGTEKYELLGVYKKDLDHIARGLAVELPEDWVDALNTLRAATIFEAKSLAVELAVRKRKSFEKRHWSDFSKWLDDCEGWALVDGLCCDLLSVFLVRWPDLAEKTDSWQRSKNLWKRRAAIVVLVRPIRDGHFADELFARMAHLAADHDPMIHKAVSWGLRSAISTHRGHVEEFLHDHESVLKPVVLREVRSKLTTGLKTAKKKNSLK